MKEEVLKYTEEYIESNPVEANLDLRTILKFSNITEKTQNIFSKKILDNACINIHFHPDRYFNERQTIDKLIDSGEYKNQYQTNTSSGSLTAKIGGDRDIWENKLFNNLYGNNIQGRPKYGSLNLTYTNDGASPRFGSCFFITSPHIKLKSTFTYGDSYLLPKERGTAKNLSQIYTRLYYDIFTRNSGLGLPYESINDFINKTTIKLESKKLEEGLSSNLDFYIEAQIHGKIDLQTDISYLVVDYSFKKTELEDKFTALCSKYNISLIWNSGYQLKEIDIPANYRGIQTQIFARKIAKKGVINAYIIGKALSNRKLKLQYDQLAFLQLSKYAWHCLVKFGKPIKPST